MRVLAFMASLAFLLGITVFPTILLAQTSTSITVSELFAPWMEILVSATALLIAASLTYATNLIRRKTGIDIEFSRMRTLQQALENAAGLALSKVASSDAKINVKSAVIRDAILYVNKSVPDAVSFFDLSGDDIAEKIVAKIGLATSLGEAHNEPSKPARAGTKTGSVAV